MPIPSGEIDGKSQQLQLPIASLSGIGCQAHVVPSSSCVGDAMRADEASTPSVARSRSGANLVSPPGLTAPPGTPSHGSILHGTGNCRPCAWFWKPGGCQNGKECGHCHLCPEGEIKARKKNKLTLLRLGLATPEADGAVVENDFFDGFGFAHVATWESQPTWTYTESFAIISEQESTNLSGSEQGSLISVGSTVDRLTANSSADRDSTSGSEYEHQGAIVTPPGPPPGLKAPADAPSHGSVLHSSGNCHPCAWFWKRDGCQNERDCKYCHLCSDGEIKARKKNKQAAMRFGRLSPANAQHTIDDAGSTQDARFSLYLAACV